MATSIRAYKDLLTSGADFEHWFEKFHYHLLEQGLVVPAAADPENVTADEANKRIPSSSPFVKSTNETVRCKL